MKKATNQFSGGGTYISNDVLGRLSFKKNIQVVVGGFFTTFFLLGIIGGLMKDDQVFWDGLISGIIILLPFVLLFLSGIRNSRKIGLARRYNLIFMCDGDGTVTVHELANQIGKPSVKVLSQLEWLFRKGVFCDCTLQQGGEPCVILSGRTGSKTSFVNVVCEKCNGTTRLRAGTFGKCEYCGSAISSRNIHG